MNADQIIRGACPPNKPNGVLPQPSYYAGRGPLEGDLNSGHLEKIHAFIKEKVGPAQAKTFTRFVDKLEDLSATAFLEGFIRLVDEKRFSTDQPGTGPLVIGHGAERDAEAGAYVFGALAQKARDPEEEENIKRRSKIIKKPFLSLHQNELGKKKKGDPDLTYGGYGMM